MDQIAALRYSRLAMTLVITAALWGCGPGDDKGKEKKAEPAPPPAPVQKKEEVKPAPKAATELPGGWVLLGQENVRGNMETDKIKVGTKQGKFKELQVVVKGAPVTIDRMTILFGSGKERQVKIQREFTAKSPSQVIDLPGETRNVNSVEFVYRASGTGKGAATVLLYGR